MHFHITDPVDIPGQFRMGDRNLAERIQLDVETCVQQLNKKSYSMFCELLELSRTPGNDDKLDEKIAAHQEVMRHQARKLLLTLGSYPDQIVSKFSAIRGVREGRRTNPQLYLGLGL